MSVSHEISRKVGMKGRQRSRGRVRVTERGQVVAEVHRRVEVGSMEVVEVHEYGMNHWVACISALYCL